MSGDDNANLIYGLICALLLISSLTARRLPLQQTVKMLLAWIAIFSAFFALFLFRDEFSEVWKRAKADFNGGVEVAANGSMRITKDDSGHFRVSASVNGTKVAFLIDTGATVTTLNPRDASSAGVVIDSSSYPVVSQTANGLATGRRARIATLNVGPISRQDFPVHVAKGLGDTNLLGMNFLSSLQGWRVEGNEMVLNPQ
jgi:aspartyl protease family protein